MSYKIAVGSSDEKQVDLKFGEIKTFLIYEITDTIKLVEKRAVKQETEQESSSCDNKSEACASGCNSNGGGCGGGANVESKLSLISDCRCLVCKKVGFQALKQLEKKAISVFDVDLDIDTALAKIVEYYGKLDNHVSLRK